ncbi:thioredoxin reductase [bacterium CG_4_10_14_0_2_um_filter_33_32]|nr:MAG: hypothetical protein AUJ93_00510 [bacterium CG2_30_33_46]PIR67803.1 MAG: thioredoxin reductase [bacterium CG10_big_fil_rev_8_21_14_0_10_33_18]PIU76830.1 MAG: thioredoxin reductase [bacterium CG06_land_8_20_14_3_00_33_50]PIW81629.1 MAG: thioredoxin reductase [bacterium CG_4_8_14_3_um_filter_33_28]PIY85513.1 MAG: thioredoxin reductase [bacterium CG_4_10_14_0_8_um_filter_33_57]PIZ85492.1 MAG: thioredoxin reductase [bacterium CG_4_10_14_0_2_um_filter_33_32]PJA72379.1 MAG: thioredoxin redu
MIMKEKKYDLIIIGAGPAGLSAALYATQYKLNTIIISERLGGTLLSCSEISNYPGQEIIPGQDLAKVFEQRIKGKISIIEDNVTKLRKLGNDFLIDIKDNNQFQSEAVILAIGAVRKKLGVKGEEEFKNRGVSYCAICDSPMFKNKSVAVVGSGNAALHAGLLISEYAKEVFILARNRLKADPVLIDKAQENVKIKMVENIGIEEIKGSVFVEKINLSRKLNGNKSMDVQGVFVEIGIEPDAEIISDFGVEKDSVGFIKVNSAMETNIPELYAAGDMTTGSNGLRQVITAAAEGAIAATSVYHMVKENMEESE